MRIRSSNHSRPSVYTETDAEFLLRLIYEDCISESDARKLEHLAHRLEEEACIAKERTCLS